MSKNSLADKPYNYAAEEKNRKGWLVIAQRVINGDYSKADRSTKISLTTGLRGYVDPICRQALEIISKS